MRELLRKKNAFTWGPEQQSSFEEAKRILVASAKLAHYDPKRESCLLSDASRLNGMGFALLQYNERNEPSLIQCGSRSFTAAERNYATIELELLGIVYAVLKCKHYLLGTRFKVVTDHAPLTPILGTDKSVKSLDQNGVQFLLYSHQKFCLVDLIIGCCFTQAQNRLGRVKAPSISIYRFL